MKLKAGVLGAGHLGKIHLTLLQQSEKYELIGFYDPDSSNGKKVENEFGYTFFDSLAALIDAVDVVDIVTPTLSHYTCAIKAITKGKHIFIEKPITNTVEEAEQIRLLISENNLSVSTPHLKLLKTIFNRQCLLKRIVWQNLILVELMFLLY
jgi:predicted dehydrogenase